MLYSIIPPILIVLSLIGIILLIAKKAPEAARLERELKANEIEKPKRKFWGRFGSRSEQNEEKKNGGKTLLMLEKITRKFKVIFLKLENLFSNWGDAIRKRRNDKAEKNEADNSARRDAEKINMKSEKTEVEQFFYRNERKEKSDGSEKAMGLKKPAEKKDLFEKALIERIAANPKDVEAYERLGEYYIEIENWEYAKECFKQVLKLDPKNSNVKTKMKKLERLFLKR